MSATDAVTTIPGSIYSHSVVVDPSSATGWGVVEGVVAEAVAVGSFTPARAHPISGFGELHVSTSIPGQDQRLSPFTDNQRAYAAGFMEAWLTAPEIHATGLNLHCQVNCDGR